MNASTLRNILSTLSVLLLLSACSSKTATVPLAQKDKVSKIDSNNTLIDEFEDEFEAIAKEIFDPFEGYNRWLTDVHDTFYTYVFDPVSVGYATVIPQPARVGISNVVHNLKFPVRFTNNLLQFKFDSSMKELGRFMINSTIGVLGIFDVAKAGGIEPQEEDFGQTLGFYGVGPGPHFVVPFFGPSNVRDALGLVLDSTMSPTNNGNLAYQIPKNSLESTSISGVEYLNKNSLHPGEYKSLKKDALDVYTFFRDSYEQKRVRDIEK